MAKITRSDLYAAVWAEPMSRLARKYAISDVALAKICRTHDVPCPPRGYWARKQFGQNPKQISLPNSKQDVVITIRDGQAHSVAPSTRASAVCLPSGVAAAELNIRVAETLRGCHELVSRANQELQAARTDSLGLIPKPEKPTLDVHVSKACLRRALLILDALLKSLESAGCEVGPGPNVLLFDATVRFEIAEELETIREQPTEHDLDGYYDFGHSRFASRRQPSGRLSLKLHDGRAYWAPSARHTWRDTDKHKLEDRLNKFVVGLVQLAHLTKDHDDEVRRRRLVEEDEAQRRKEAAQERAEKRKLIKAEQGRVNDLIRQARSWSQSERLRGYIEAVRQKHEATNGDIAQNSDVSNWLEWATQQADRLDPLRENPPSVLDEQLPAEEEVERQSWRPRWQ